MPTLRSVRRYAAIIGLAYAAILTTSCDPLDATVEVSESGAGTASISLNYTAEAVAASGGLDGVRQQVQIMVGFMSEPINTAAIDAVPVDDGVTVTVSIPFGSPDELNTLMTSGLADPPEPGTPPQDPIFTSFALTSSPTGWNFAAEIGATPEGQDAPSSVNFKLVLPADISSSNANTVALNTAIWTFTPGPTRFSLNATTDPAISIPPATVQGSAAPGEGSPAQTPAKSGSPLKGKLVYVLVLAVVATAAGFAIRSKSAGSKPAAGKNMSTPRLPAPTHRFPTPGFLTPSQVAAEVPPSFAPEPVQPHPDTAPQVPPGWFADPYHRASQRWWSGSEWTNHTG